MTVIDGIEILSQEPIMGRTYLGFIIFIVGVALSLVIGILLEIFYLKDGLGFLIIVMGLGVFCMIGMVVENIYLIPTNRYEYKVTITDDVSFNELYEHYEIVDQEGKIFIIREKENIDG